MSRPVQSTARGDNLTGRDNAVASAAGRVQLPGDEDGPLNALKPEHWSIILKELDQLMALEQRHRDGQLSADEQEQLVKLAGQAVTVMHLSALHLSLAMGAEGKLQRAKKFLSISSGAVEVALLRLAAAGVRLPPFLDPGPNQRQQANTCCLRAAAGVHMAACALIHSLIGIDRGDAPRCAALEAFALALVRMQTPQACAQQLKTAVDRLEQSPVTEEERQQVEALLGRAVNLLHGLSLFAHNEAKLTGRGQAVGPFLRELSSALEDSCVLEHLTQMLLRLPPPPPAAATEPAQQPGTAAALSFGLATRRGAMATIRQLIGCRDSLLRAAQSVPTSSAAAGLLLSRSDAASSPVQLLDRVTSGPCLTHTAIVAGLSALCAGDGGSAYGLPPEVLGCFGGMEEEMGYSMWQHSTLLLMVRAIRSAAKAGRLGRRAAQLLLMRAAHLGLASAQAGHAGVAAPAGQEKPAQSLGSDVDRNQRRTRDSIAAAAAVTAEAATAEVVPGETAGGRRRPLLEPVGGADVAVCALDAAWKLLADRPAIWLAGAEECWRVALALCERVCVAAIPLQDYRLNELGNTLLAPLPSVDLEHPPPEAPPALAVALTAGLLPCLERLVRQAGGQPAGIAAEVLIGVNLFAFQRSWHALAPLLAYSEPRQAAAFVVSMGKTLRHIAASISRRDNVSYATPGAAARFLISSMPFLRHLATAGTPEAPAAAAADEEGDGTSGAAVSQSGPHQRRRQLGLMVSYAVTEWLPALAETLPHIRDELSAGELLGLAPVVVMLAMRAGGGGGSPGPTAATAAASAARAADLPGVSTGAQPGGVADNVDDSSTGSSSASWRRFLLEEVRVVRLLEVTLARPSITPGVEASTLAAVADAVMLVAAVFHEELRAATVAAVKAAVAAAHQQHQQQQHRQRARRGVATRSGGRRGGFGGDASGDSMLVSVQLPWGPEALRGMVSELRAAGLDSRAEAVQVLASEVEGWVASADGCGLNSAFGLAVVRKAVCDWIVQEFAPAARLLAPPGAARRLIGVCANPGCMRLEGDSELAGPQLQVCKGCRAVGYCCRECQVAHWKAGHRKECQAAQ